MIEPVIAIPDFGVHVGSPKALAASAMSLTRTSISPKNSSSFTGLTIEILIHRWQREPTDGRGQISVG
ncbi:hypothetical protein, partial [Stieleria sp.]|uniref:hypothetical protein n=1 Tax=Stieleria sp. TaxID=2795976 RepID=UPI0035633823